MPKLPIEFQKVKVSREIVSFSLETKPRTKQEIIQYLVTVSEKGEFWKTTALCSRQEIIDLRDKLNKLLADITTAEILSVSEAEARIIDTAYAQDALCQNCEYQLTQNCVTCLFTLPDFFIEKNRQRLCIYTDGHTYHERTEEQAQRDRNIDRKLQELGFRVLRYTGKEVNENLPKVIAEVKNWLDTSKR